MQRRGIIVVALHLGAFAGDRHHRDAMARAEIGAAEAVAGDQHHAADAGRRRGAARLGDALAPPCPRLLGGLRQLFQLGHRRQFAVDQVEIGDIARQQAFVGKPGIFVFRRHARHRHRAIGECRDVVAGHVIGRDHRLALAHQHAQAQIVALRAFGFLHRAVAHLDSQRHRAHRHRVGGIGAGLARGRRPGARRGRAGRSGRTGIWRERPWSGFHDRAFIIGCSLGKWR